MRWPEDAVIEGRRVNGGARVTIRTATVQRRNLPLRRDVWDHSPTGPEWGYGGSGPAQLALGLCCLILSADEAVSIHQEFKRRFVSRLPREGWSFTVAQIRGFVLQVLDERRRTVGEGD